MDRARGQRRRPDPPDPPSSRAVVDDGCHDRVLALRRGPRAWWDGESEGWLRPCDAMELGNFSFGAMVISEGSTRRPNRLGCLGGRERTGSFTWRVASGFPVQLLVTRNMAVPFLLLLLFLFLTFPLLACLGAAQHVYLDRSGLQSQD